MISVCLFFRFSITCQSKLAQMIIALLSSWMLTHFEKKPYKCKKKLIVRFMSLSFSSISRIQTDYAFNRFLHFFFEFGICDLVSKKKNQSLHTQFLWQYLLKRCFRYVESSAVSTHNRLSNSIMQTARFHFLDLWR